MSTITNDSPVLRAMTTDIVAAYVSKNHVAAGDVPGLVATVHAALAGLVGAAPAPVEELPTLTPAEIKKSIKPDGLISFIDGRPYKTLKRHLSSNGLNPDSYRARFGLPADYPMTAPSYSARRSELAKQLGLGVQHRQAAE
ncbi:MucR family transcriptional regulator [Methylobacterium komagatae]|uniref:MucR family transcriptional regulator n=1 Tax=Methylobacterium komagatae TaxID=374425 RepID=A0ABW2BJJ0_9HYPH